MCKAYTNLFSTPGDIRDILMCIEVALNIIYLMCSYRKLRFQNIRIPYRTSYDTLNVTNPV